MNPADRDTAVKELQAAMRAKLASRTPDNARDTDASIMLFSNVLKALTAEPAVPSTEDEHARRQQALFDRTQARCDYNAALRDEQAKAA